MRNTPRELRLLELANRQYGVLHDGQLIRRGLSRKAIDQRVSAARLSRLHDGVFAWGHSALTREGRWLAALWACGEGAVLSHTTAAAFKRWRRRSATRSTSRPPGRFSHAPASSCTASAAWTPPTSRGGRSSASPWTRSRWFSPAALRGAQQRAPGRRGRGAVTRLLEADEAHTKSELERRFLRFVGRHALPRPTGLNVRVAGFKVDCLYAQHRLVVELDGRAYHRRRSQMAADRRRDEGCQLAGHRIQRLLWDDFHAAREHDTAERLRRMLDG